MKQSKQAFTLIEMMISITILSIMMIFLYQTNATLHLSNANLKNESEALTKIQKIKQVVYLDFLSAVNDANNSISILQRDKKEDFVSFMSKHSLHQRINPYITYIVKDKKLYRLESLEKISTVEISSEQAFDIDSLGEVDIFRLYKAKTKTSTDYLAHIKFHNKQEILLKIHSF